MPCSNLKPLMGCLALALSLPGAEAAEPSLIPWPAAVTSGTGSFALDARTRLCASNDAERAAADRLQAVLKAVQGIDLDARGCDRAGVTFALSPTVAEEEGYTLDVSSNGVKIQARAAPGLFYGAMTAAQLLSAGTVPAVHIEDAPRFRWRGLMLDSARHFFPVAEVKSLLEQMSQHKLNVLHFHLTDDQGWRIEIERYPELTKVGAWRTPPGESAVYGGFYTQHEIRDLVRYAAARHITIVPEIDLPGHAQAVVAAHPKLSVTGERPQVSNKWGVNEYLYNTDDYSLAFVKHVLDEVLQLFPGKYIHLGGDEAIKDQWRASSAVQAQIKALKLANEDELQNWFMQQLGRYLAERGRVMIGWDEILEAKVPSTATVMSWRGVQGAITAARLGHDVVMSPAPTLYFDNLQSRRDDEPAGRLNVQPLSQVYNFEVMPAVLGAEERSRILGAQANLWSEYLTSSWHLQHAAFPRIGALAEAVWTPQSKLSWRSFLARLPAQMGRYRRQGIAAADTAFAVDFDLKERRNAALRAGAGTVALYNQTNFGDIRYTLDGSSPNRRSQLFTAPLSLQFGTIVKATAFAADGAMLAVERTYEFSADALLTRTSNQLQACPGDSLGLRLPLTPDATAAAPVFDVNLLNSCYIYPEASTEGVKALRVDIARLPRNFGLANRKNQLKSYPARTPFGELVIYRERCEAGAEIARVALADPGKSDQRQALQVPIAPTSGEPDLCFIFSGDASGPLYAIDRVTLQR